MHSFYDRNYGKTIYVCAFGGLRLGSREVEVENLGFTLPLWKN